MSLGESGATSGRLTARIVSLSAELTNQIAAGEVVERPASIIKELLENALDAGATKITVALDEGGLAGIDITDNGAGIVPEDVPLAFGRHTTSKIRSFLDLSELRSYGFRGEALPSIASIARVEMLTRPRGFPTGTRLVIKFGQVEEQSEVGAPVGTRIRVTEIFGNVPARKKFLKSRATELKHSLETVTRVGLPHPGLDISVLADARQVISIPAIPDLAERMALALGRDLAAALMPLEGFHEGLGLAGFITTPEVSRATAGQIRSYVNNRYVNDALVRQAVATAIRGRWEPQKYPVACLFLTVPPEEVDVNVHPAKMEVRFRRPRDVYDLVVSTLGTAIAGGRGWAGRRDFPASGREMSAGEEKNVREEPKRYRVIPGPASKTPSGLFSFSRQPSLPVENERPTPTPEAGEYWGQFGASYLVFSSPSGIMIVDQHAAHERIIYEDLKQRSRSRAPAAGETLLFPETALLSAGDYAFFLSVRELFAESGWDVEPFGEGTLLIRALPGFLQREKPALILQEIIDELQESGRSQALDERRERLWRSLACRSSLMAGDGFGEEKARELLARLAATPDSMTCPHGRPISIVLSEADLERLFKRR